MCTFETKYVFFVQGYKAKTPDSGTLTDFVEVQVFAENPAEAVEKAKKLIDKPYYRISKVFEKDYICSCRKE